MNTHTGIQLNELKPVKINYQVGRSIISLNNPSIEIVNGVASFNGTNDYGVHMSLQAPTESLSLVGSSVSVAQSYNFSTNNVNNNVLRETYKITDIQHAEHFITVFYEQPTPKNYKKIEPLPSKNAEFFALNEEVATAFAESLHNNRNAIRNYNSFINRNRNRPDVTSELKNEIPKNVNLQYEYLKEFFKNNKEEIKKILDL